MSSRDGEGENLRFFHHCRAYIREVNIRKFQMGGAMQMIELVSVQKSVVTIQEATIWVIGLREDHSGGDQEGYC